MEHRDEFHDMEDVDLVERAKVNEEAFQALYDRYFDKIYRFVFRRVGHKETCEDIVSMVFGRTFLHIQDWKWQGYSFGAWLYRVAGNIVIDYWRKNGKKREVELETIIESAATGASAKEWQEREDAKNTVSAVLQKIPGKYAEVLSMKFFGEQSNAEIAQMLGVSTNHVGVLIYRGLKRCLREMRGKIDKLTVVSRKSKTE